MSLIIGWVALFLAIGDFILFFVPSPSKNNFQVIEVALLLIVAVIAFK